MYEKGLLPGLYRDPGPVIYNFKDTGYSIGSDDAERNVTGKIRPNLHGNCFARARMHLFTPRSKKTCRHRPY